MATSISEMVRSTGPASRLERLAALAFVVALSIPAIAYLAGVRPPELENSTPAALPAWSIGALTETATYAQVDRSLADNLPGRDVAVGAYADLDYRALRGSTNPDVIVGAGDWLFFSGELRPTCADTADEFLGAIDTVREEASAAGIDVRVAIAPDKHGIYPERLGPAAGLPRACTDERRETVRAGMADRPETTVDLWAPVRAGAASAAPEPVYFAQDSHWTPTGALPAIRALVESLAPGTWDDRDITVKGTSTYPQELARLIGLPSDAPVPAYVVRPQMTVERGTVPTDVHLTGATDIARYRTTGDGRVVPGTTLVIYDSFFNINRPRITPWFEDTIWVHIDDLRAHPELVDDLPAYDRVVVERVERSAYDLGLVGLLRPVIEHVTPAP